MKTSGAHVKRSFLVCKNTMLLPGLSDAKADIIRLNAMFYRAASCCRYLRTFMMEEQDVDAILKDCAFCITFVGIWRRDVLARPGVDLRKGFLTRETATDDLSSCQTLVLAVKLFREHYQDVKMVPSRSVPYLM